MGSCIVFEEKKETHQIILGAIVSWVKGVLI
jgi:hypothetical protein